MRRMTVVLFALITAALVGMAGLAFSSTPLLSSILSGRPTATPAANEIIYVVQEGDTLSAIARRFATTVTTLIRRNELASADLIIVGQRLIIPPPGATAFPTYTLAPTQTQRASPIAITSIPATDAPTSEMPTLPPTEVLPETEATEIRSLPTAAPTPTPVSTLPFELGGHVISFSYPRQMHAAGMTWARSTVRWTRGAAPDIAQGAVDAARTNGFKILLTVVGDPVEMANDIVRYSQEFATFLGGVAALQPDAIEVWTAPNVSGSWVAGAISPSAYTQMLVLSFEAIKRISPSTLVISAAPESTPTTRCNVETCDPVAYTRLLASEGAGSYADCIGIRYNIGATSPDRNAGDPRGDNERYYFMPMLAQYAEIFPNKPLCLVEVGYLVGQPIAELPEDFAWSARTTVQNQAEWLARATILARQTGRIRLMVVWNIDAMTFSANNPASTYTIIQNEQCLSCITLGTVMGVR